MTISTTPFALQAVPLNADVVREAVSSLVPNGGGLLQSGDMAVRQTSTASMSVLVGVGRAWLCGSDIAFLSGQKYGKQGMYFVMNDADFTVTLAAANATNPRIDVVYVCVQDAAYAGTQNQAVISVVTGTPSSSPAVPSIPSNAIKLAQVLVGASVSSVTNSKITNTVNTILSPAPALTHAEFTGSNVPITGGVSGPGVLTKDSTTSYDANNVITCPSGDTLQFADVGIYAVSWVGILSAGVTGTNTFMALKSNDLSVVYTSTDMPPGSQAAGVSIPNLYISVPNQQIRCECVLNFGGNSVVITSRVRATRIR